ncbi:MAG: UDP-N-acetylmuramoyl-tripeptide--D-alanyl-D-alanine ligase [bacterium]|nr:UDP-N-acetylmuramoyl-tripeptide--D-alanyl-D-alanine ligase [bacterium]
MIKKIAKNFIAFILRVEARLILRKYKPKIIAVTGTVGKTSAKDAIFTVLSREFFVRKSEKSYNSEIGVPLAIIGGRSGWGSPLRWLLVLFKGLRMILVRHDYPEWLVLEMGVDRPKDMEKLTAWIKPDAAVITMVGEVPVHIEYFEKQEDLLREKAKLAKAVKEGGYVILNGDDESVFKIKEKTRANTVCYGFSEGLDIVASNYRVVFKEQDGKSVPEGITFKVDYKGNIVPVRMPGVFGRQAVYTALAAIATGGVFGLNLIEMSEALSRHYKSPPGRLKFIEGINGSFIFDDTYNSSPVAVTAALDFLEDVANTVAKRKIAVLGDMMELGKHTIDEHKKIGRMLKGKVDMIFTVGPRSKFSADEARAVGFNPENIFVFSSVDEAKVVLRDKIKEGDLILVKGSQSMRMEKIVEEIMARPEKKKKLLVRQEKEWLNR